MLSAGPRKAAHVVLSLRSVWVMLGKLVERREGRAERVHFLGPVSVTIGRGEENTIVVVGSFVSRVHAELCWNEGHYVLRDLSRNGTFLNGNRIMQPEPLRYGDLITLPGLPGVVLAFATSDETPLWSPVGTANAAIRLDATTGEVWVRGQRTELRRQEYLALNLLAGKSGILVTKDELAQQVWPERRGDVKDNEIAQLLAGLRRKLEDDPRRPRHLITVRGRGYRLLLS
jgi:hypothetical protein